MPLSESLSMRGLFARVTELWFGSSNGREDKAIIVAALRDLRDCLGDEASTLGVSFGVVERAQALRGG